MASYVIFIVLKQFLLTTRYAYFFDSFIDNKFSMSDLIVNFVLFVLSVFYFDNRDDFLFSFAIAEGEDQNGRLSIDPTTGVITWSNDGSTLLEDTPAHVVITLQVPGIVTFETVIPITLKKTTVGGE